MNFSTLTPKFGTVILAAGTSSRMGSPKQLLPWGEVSLLRHAIRVARAAEIGPVAVVVGANAEVIIPEVESENAQVIQNSQFALGQGSSVRAGAKWAIHEKWEGVLFMVCDQPEITSADLKKILQTSIDEHLPMVASQYGKELGVPAFFRAKYFKDLLEIPEGQGAKSVLKAGLSHLKTVNFLKGLHDIDTQDEYQEAWRRVHGTRATTEGDS